MKRLMTLVIVERRGKLLLGMKKRGFGEGRWNGFGGKLEGTETIVEAAKREVLEEVGILAHGLRQVGLLTFSFESDKDLVLEVHVFMTSDFSGEPVEAGEMKPQWFSYDAIPYNKMWPDDEHWLPKVLEDKLVEGSFLFDTPASKDHKATILSLKVREVDGF